MAAFVAYCLFLAYALIPSRRGAERTGARAPDEDPAAAFWARQGLCLALFAVVAMVHLRNAYVYPHARGFDAVQHADYVRFVADRWQVPDASQGWEMSQPPLYYVLSAGLYRLCGGRLERRPR